MTVVDLYTIQIISCEPVPKFALNLDDLIHAHRLPDLIGEAEENLTDLLPAGYRARIRRWNQPDNEGNDDE
jgi:hypothetical protein